MRPSKVSDRLVPTARTDQPLEHCFFSVMTFPKDGPLSIIVFHVNGAVNTDYDEQ